VPNYWFDHVHLISPDPRKTAEFYEKMFGARQVSMRDLGNGRVVVNLNLNGTTILVSPQRDDNARTGLDHFGIRTDNLDKAVDELKTNGVKFTQDITEVRPDFKISFLLAPENVSIELQEGSL
jgi:lactoylglutathione lyase